MKRAHQIGKRAPMPGRVVRGQRPPIPKYSPMFLSTLERLRRTVFSLRKQQTIAIGEEHRAGAVGNFLGRGPMETPHTFRLQADLCLRQAEHAKTPQHRAGLLEMAQTWLGLADW